jgi:hypothetical protein
MLVLLWPAVFTAQAPTLAGNSPSSKSSAERTAAKHSEISAKDITGTQFVAAPEEPGAVLFRA